MRVETRAKKSEVFSNCGCALWFSFYAARREHGATKSAVRPAATSEPFGNVLSSTVTVRWSTVTEWRLGEGSSPLRVTRTERSREELVASAFEALV